MWGLEVWRAVMLGGSAGDKALARGPGPRPAALKHLLEDSAEPSQEAMAEVVVGADLVSLLP